MSHATPSRWVRVLFDAYQGVLSPVLHALSPTQCRYLPTCSEYAYVATVQHGVVAGCRLALRRVARCHPWSAGGFDPVPERGSGSVRRAPGCTGKSHDLS